MIEGLVRCLRCGAIIYDDDYDEKVDLPEFCSLCNQEVAWDDR